jgi:hypothetical protein
MLSKYLIFTHTSALVKEVLHRSSCSVFFHFPFSRFCWSARWPGHMFDRHVCRRSRCIGALMLGRDEALAGVHGMGVLERLLGATFQYALWYYRYSSLECASPAFILALRRVVWCMCIPVCVVVDAAAAPFKLCLDGNVDSPWQKKKHLIPNVP